MATITKEEIESLHTQEFEAKLDKIRKDGNAIRAKIKYKIEKSEKNATKYTIIAIIIGGIIGIGLAL
jgi:hypothetical protein